jgi:DNA-binding MarR family transcriptional regulator
MKTTEMLFEQTMRMMNQLIFLEKKFYFTYKELTLFPSEIHLLGLISEGASVNATTMADKLGVTKGAVSQTLSRLEKKKAIIKTKDPFNKNVLTVQFTPTGLNALQSFSKMRMETKNQFLKYLGALTANEKTIINTFLGQMELFIKELE